MNYENLFRSEKKWIILQKIWENATKLCLVCTVVGNQLSHDDAEFATSGDKGATGESEKK